MKTEINLEGMVLQNFKGVKEKTVYFFHKTEVLGKNEAGKTTLNDAFNWVLFGKDSNGNTKFDVRPQDADGKQIDFVEIDVRLFLKINGKRIEIEKKQVQKWVTKRGNEESVFEGNENSFVVNTIPKSEKEFKNFMDELVSEDVFKYVSNTNAFMGLNAKERRKTLFELVADIDTKTILATDQKLQDGLGAQLDEYTYDEILSRDKKALSEYKKDLTEIPSRIDEVSRQIVEVDYTDAEIKLAGLRKELSSVSEVGAESLAKFEEIAYIKGRILNAKSNLQEIESTEREKANSGKRELENNLYDAETSLRKAGAILSLSINAKEDCEKQISLKTVKLKNLQDEYKAEKELVFDNSKTICPVCQSEFKADKKEEMIAAFEKDKAAKMLEINKSGKIVSDDLKALREELAKIEVAIPTRQVEVDGFKKSVDEIKEKMDQLPKKDFDVMECKEYLDVLAVIEQLQKDLSVSEESVKDVEKLKEEVAVKKKVIQEQIDECNRTLNGKKTIENAKLRVIELVEEQKAVTSRIATTEKEMFLLEEFNKAKVNLLSEKINSHFKVVKWKLFERQINGGYNEICEPLVNGKSYTTALNSGHKILAELDIINALQKIYDCSVPVFLDNAERINKFNVPDMDCQLITMSVAENEELEIREVV